MTSPGPLLSVEGIVKRYVGVDPALPAVSEVSFSVEEGRFYTLLGPSGCGKSTTLRLIAGLEKTDAGSISIEGRVVSSHHPRVFVRPDERDVGMVFQSYAIWPHMTVFDNVAFPLRAVGRKHRTPRNQIRSLVMEELEKVQLAKFADRIAAKLSGGQQQRLALARALARQPKLLLLDEPLSNLDATLRELMRAELRQLQRNLGVTTLYVTHDQSEALSMSNRVAVMEAGKIVQEGTPREIYRRPGSAFVATFVGRTNVVDAVIKGPGPDGTQELETAMGRLFAKCPPGISVNETVSLSVRPEDLRLHAVAPTDRPNVLKGHLEYRLFLGETDEYHIRIGGQLLIARQDPYLELPRREDMFVEFPASRCVVVSDEFGSTDHGSTVDVDDPRIATQTSTPEESGLEKLALIQSEIGNTAGISKGVL